MAVAKSSKRLRFCIHTVRQKYHKNSVARCWISPNALRNACLGKFAEDWLTLYGKSKGFMPDEVDNHFQKTIMQQGVEFENTVVNLIKSKCQHLGVDFVENDRSMIAADQLNFTKKHIIQQSGVIYQALVVDSEERLFGYPDLLVSDQVFEKLFGHPLQANTKMLKEDSAKYVVIDIKRSPNAGLVKASNLADSGIAKHFKKIEPPTLHCISQLYFYNNCVGKLTGQLQSFACILAANDSWLKGGLLTVSHSQIQLDHVQMIEFNMQSSPMCHHMYNLIDWVRALKCEGSMWSPQDDKLKKLIKKESKTSAHQHAWSQVIKDLSVHHCS